MCKTVVISRHYFCAEIYRIQLFIVFMRYLFLVLVMIVASVTANAYKVEGVVTDSSTGETLVGAIVSCKELPGVGTSSGLDGSYVLEIPSGKKVTLVWHYVSYENYEAPVSGDATVNVALKPEDNVLGEVSVIGSANRRTDASARMVERTSANILNIMSANSIEVSPDLDVAGVLQRMSGVVLDKGSSDNEQYAILRGMDKRYNYTLVNGVKIPSPDDANRYVPLNIFPSDLLDRLEVTKSLTADMEGDATGGVVNMVMKNAPSRFTFNANVAGGYNTMNIENKFIGFDHGNITSESPREAFGTEYQATLGDFKRGTTTLDYYHPMPDIVAGLTVGNRLLDNRLGFIFAGSLQNTYRTKSSLFFTDNMNQRETAVRLSDMRERVYSEQQLQTGLHLKLDYTFNADNDIEWYNSFFSNISNQVRDSVETNLSLNYDPENGDLLQTLETRARQTKQSIFASTLTGHHNNLLLEGLGLDWTAEFADARYKRPDNTYTSLENLVQNHESVVTADHGERRFEHNSDRDIAGYLNLKYDRKVGHFDLNVKAGGMYRDKSRDNTHITYNFTPGGSSRPVQGVDFDNINEIAWQVTTPHGSVGPLNYTADENIGAVYGQIKLARTKWHVIAGLRAEHTLQSYSMTYPTVSNDPESKQRYWDVLPSVHVKYSPIKDMNIRASYFKSINRPGFFEIVPYTIINEDYLEFGNNELKRARIDNVDLRWEWYPSASEEFMAGVFYKHLTDPIEYVSRTINRQVGYGPDNVGNATNYGVEIDIIKYFRNFGVKANYTYTHSKITTTKILYGQDAEGNTKRFDVEQSRPLLGQAPHVANLTLMYKDTKHGWDAQLACSYTGEKIAIVSQYLDSDYWDKGEVALDASVEKKFKCGVTIFGKGTNLLNTASERYIKTHNDYNDKFPGQNPGSGKTLIRKDRRGIGLLLGVRFKL